MNRTAHAFVLFLLATGALVSLTPFLASRTMAQGGSEWTGTLTGSFKMHTTPSLGWTSGVQWSFSFSFTVSGAGQIAGTGSGSEAVTLDYPTNSNQTCSPNSAQAFYGDGVNVTGSSTVGMPGELNFAFTTESHAGSTSTLCRIPPGSTQQPLSGSGCLASVCIPPNDPYALALFDGSSRSFSLPLPSGVFPAGTGGGGVAGNGTVTIKIHSVSRTTLLCYPSQQLVGRFVNCEADVFGNSPTGAVTEEASSNRVELLYVPGVVGPAPCLIYGDTYGSAACRFIVASSSAGVYNITVHYPGDSRNPPSNASARVTFLSPPGAGIVQGQSRLSLSCDPSIANGTVQAACIARVTGSPPLPTGNVTWSNGNQAGVLASRECALANGSCGVTYFEGNVSKAATATVMASYPGDSLHLPASASDTISVLTGTDALVDQRQTTGLMVKVTGTPGAFVNASSTYYYAQPGGTGSAPFLSNTYLDLRVSGTVNGNVQVCYYGANVNNTTTLRYYQNRTWNGATNVDALGEESVCGDIPLSALSGTLLDVGGGTPSTTGTSTTASTSSSSLSTSTLTPPRSSTTSASATASASASATSAGGGVPEFSPQLFLAALVAFIVSLSYILARGRPTPLRRT